MLFLVIRHRSFPISSRQRQSFSAYGLSNGGGLSVFTPLASSAYTCTFLRSLHGCLKTISPWYSHMRKDLKFLGKRTWTRWRIGLLPFARLSPGYWSYLVRLTCTYSYSECQVEYGPFMRVKFIHGNYSSSLGID